jgi:hypothetical protein
VNDLDVVPPYIGTGDVARACDMSWKAAKGMLDRAGILERLGERWVVGQSRLMERLPDVYGRVYEHFKATARSLPQSPTVSRQRPESDAPTG